MTVTYNREGWVEGERQIGRKDIEKVRVTEHNCWRWRVRGESVIARWQKREI